MDLELERMKSCLNESDDDSAKDELVRKHTLYWSTLYTVFILHTEYSRTSLHTSLEYK